MCGGGSPPKPKAPPQPEPIQPTAPPKELVADVKIGADEGATKRKKIGRSSLRTSASSTPTKAPSGLGS